MAVSLETIRSRMGTSSINPEASMGLNDYTPVRNSGFGKTGPLPTAPAPAPVPTPVRDSGFGKSGPLPTAPQPSPVPTPVRDSGFGKTGPLPNPAPPMSTGYPALPATGNGTVVNAQVNPQELTSVNLQQLLASNSPYIRSAERAGQRTAASRGLLNSSMAAGASRRAAIEAGAPIAESDAQAYSGAANTTREFIYRDALANNDTQRQDWLASSAYTRDFNGRLAMMPIASSFDFFNSAMQAALEDPSIYPPEVINSLSNFNMQQLNQLLAQYLGGKP